MTNVLLFDAGPLISFAMNGLLPELRKLKKIFPGKFIITKEVHYEIIDRPLTIKRFELEALKLKELVNDGILEFPDSLGIESENISKKTQILLNIANSTFTEKNRNIHIIDLGETSILALSKILDKKNIKNLLVIDERTTRILCEKPNNLKKLLQKKLHIRIEIKNTNLHYFAGFKIIRSCELGYMIYKKGLMRIKNNKILDALLYALQFKGCSISGDEIRKIKKLS